jgi:spore germination cell wall hydrolase CwlJ-like protein
MEAVAGVIMNRVAQQTWFRLTPYEVCHKPYQFSCWLQDDPNYPKLIAVTTDDPQFALACDIAQSATQPNWMDMTDGALSYYSTTIPAPSWAIGKSPCYTCGNMLFFNDIN